MKKSISSKKSSIAAKTEPAPNIADMLNKIQQQLFFMDKKMDTMIRCCSEKPSGEKRFSKPFQHPDHSRRQPGIGQENNFRERTLYKAICADCNKECEVPFKPSGNRPVYCKECFARRKNPAIFKKISDNLPRETAPVQASHSDKGHGVFHKKSGEKKRSSSRRKK